MTIDLRKSSYSWQDLAKKALCDVDIFEVPLGDFKFNVPSCNDTVINLASFISSEGLSLIISGTVDKALSLLGPGGVLAAAVLDVGVDFETECECQ